MIIQDKESCLCRGQSGKRSEQSDRKKALLGEGTIYDQGLNKDAKVEVRQNLAPSETAGIISSLLGMLIPVLLVGGLFVFMFRQAQGRATRPWVLAESCKLYGSDKQKVVFDDIAGSEETKEDLVEVVDFSQTPEKIC